MIIIALSNLETDYKQVVDQAVQFFEKLPSNQVEYIDYDRHERYPLTRFIFIGDMIDEMTKYAKAHYQIDERFFYCLYSSRLYLNYENTTLINLLTEVKILLNNDRCQKDVNMFNMEKIVFASPFSITKRFIAMVYTMFHDFCDHLLEFLYNENDNPYNEEEMTKLMAYLSLLHSS
jgi:hypothetical protein